MWNEKADVLVAGYGGAGAAAAVAAHDAGAEVILIEKSERAGGNTRLSGGTLREIKDAEKAILYFKAISDQTVSQAVIRVFIEETDKNPQWIRDIGGELERASEGAQKFPPSLHVIWPFLPGAEGMGGRWNIKGNSKPGGTNLCNVMIRAIQKRKIKVLFNTAAKKLIKSESGEINGIVADSPQGRNPD